MTEAVILSDLHPREYEHPFEAKALDALQKTPGLHLLVRQFSKHLTERQITVQYTGSNLRITAENYPEIYQIFDRACELVNLPARPDFYLEWSYGINGFTIGVDHPIVVLNSGAVDLLSKEELLFVIGHELGHIKSRHQLYHQIGSYFPVLANTVGQATLGTSKLITTPMRIALMHWSRMSEFTADRAGMLACQNFDLVTRVMMKWAGMPISHYPDMKLDSFLNQAREFDELNYDNLNKAMKYMLIMNSTHPWTVMRAAELLKWTEGGEYQAVLDRQTRDRVNIRFDGDVQSCRKCEYRLEAGEKFCPSCGAKLRSQNSG